MKFTYAHLLLFSVLIAICIPVNATHYRSGEISYRMIGNYQIEATVTTYAKWSSPSNLADKDTVNINWGDGTNSTLLRSDSGFVAEDILKSIYKGVHTYPNAGSTGFYILSFIDQNRMAGINNISDGNSVEVPFYIEDTLFLDNMRLVGGNSSPVFFNCPCNYANAEDTFNFNPVAFDADGDSLVFESIIPMRDKNANVPLYIYPDQYCENLGEISRLSFDRQTRQINWATPCAPGFFDIAFLVKEYRCGIPLGTMIFDMQIIVLYINNDPPQISSLHDTIIAPGETIQFQITASDPQTSQMDSLKVLGGAFGLATNPPVFQSATGNPVSGTFSWQPDIGAARKHAYIFSAIARDDYKIQGSGPANLTDHETFRVWVTDTTTCLISGIEEPTEHGHSAKIYPDPTNGKCTLTIDPELTGSRMELYSMDGQMIYNTTIQQPATELDLPMPAGLYIIHLSSEKAFISIKFIRL